MRIPSVVRPGDPTATEAAVAAYVERWLRAEGFTIEVHEVAPGRPNVLASLGDAAAGPTLLLEGHTDVVTEGNRGRVEPRAVRRRPRRWPDLRTRQRRHEERAGRGHDRGRGDQAQRDAPGWPPRRGRAGGRGGRHDRRPPPVHDRPRPRAVGGDHLRARAERAVSRAARGRVGQGDDARPHGPRRHAGGRGEPDHRPGGAAPGGAGAGASAAPPLPSQSPPAPAHGHADGGAGPRAGGAAIERDSLGGPGDARRAAHAGPRRRGRRQGDRRWPASR